MPLKRLHTSTVPCVRHIRSMLDWRLRSEMQTAAGIEQAVDGEVRG